MKYRPPKDAGEFEFDLLGRVEDAAQPPKSSQSGPAIPMYVENVKVNLEEILAKSDLCLWLMIDRLDEIFPRRSPLETRALRGLLRAMRVFDSPRVRIKVFLRDDILEQVVASGNGFTALTHLTARQADTLRWSEDQILTMIVKRLFAAEVLCSFLGIDKEKLDASREYREQAFYLVFPRTVHAGSNQSHTLRWIYNHTADGWGVVTPRDVIVLLTRAKQRQQDEFSEDPSGDTEWLIGPTAIRYGLTELSKGKRTDLLGAEFPHLLNHIKKFVGGKTEYGENAMQRLLGNNWRNIGEDLVSIGLFSKTTGVGRSTYRIPFVFRDGLELTQGRMD